MTFFVEPFFDCVVLLHMTENIIKYATLGFGIFAMLFATSFSFPFQLIPNIGAALEPFYNMVLSIEAGWFGLEQKEVFYHSAEDTKMLLLHVCNLLLLSQIVMIVIWYGWKAKISLWSEYARVFLRYYLAVILLIYGFDKVYKWQFYLPESNILYTRVKDLSQDMLYWTTMGTSYSYSVFAGVAEVLAGLLLLFRRTLLLGLLLSFAVLLNVWFVNFGFDITIKLYSGFLLLISLVLLSPYIRPLITFFRGKMSQLPSNNPVYSKKRSYYFLKVIVVMLILIESQFKYFAMMNFNDDKAARPEINGAYQVLTSSVDGLEYIHFHRHGYAILQMEDDQMLDFKMGYGEKDGEMIFTDYQLRQSAIMYQIHQDTLFLKGVDDGFFIKAVRRVD